MKVKYARNSQKNRFKINGKTQLVRLYFIYFLIFFPYYRRDKDYSNQQAVIYIIYSLHVSLTSNIRNFVSCFLFFFTFRVLFKIKIINGFNDC